MTEPETYPMPTHFKKELSKVKNTVKIQTAKLTNQLKRYDKLSIRFEELEAELKQIKSEHENELERLSQKHEQAISRKQRQNDLILQQMAELEEQGQQGDELTQLKERVSQLEAENQTLSKENKRLWEEIEWVSA